MTSMGPHSDCGRDIVWVRRADDNDRWMPPLEFAGQAIIIQDDEAVFVSTYRRHECNPEEIKAWLELKRQQAEAKGYSLEDIDAHEERIIARERDREEVNSHAMSVECKVCKATVGEMCMSLPWLKKGTKRYNKNPHPPRIEDAARAS